MKKLSYMIFTLVLMSFAGTSAMADIEGKKHSAHKKSHERMGHHQHNMHKHSEPDEMHQHNNSEKSGMFLKKKKVDGYDVSFHVMGARKAMKHKQSHNLMVKVEKDGSAVKDIVANSKVTHPNGKSESKILRKMGDWYMAGYDLGHDGQHQLMVLFKTTDGKKHFSGVFFPENEPNQASDTGSQGAENEQHH